MTYRILSLAAALAALAGPAGAMTPDAGGQTSARSVAPRSAIVDVSRFDLRTADGVERAHRRIVSTAHQLCDGALHGVSSDIVAYRSCIAVSVDGAIRRSGDDLLVRFHYGLPEDKRASLFAKAPASWPAG